MYLTGNHLHPTTIIPPASFWPHFFLFCAEGDAELCLALGMGGAWGFIEALQKPRQNLQAHNMLNPQTAGMTGGLGTTARVAAGSPGLGSAASAAGGAASSSASQATRQSGKLILNNILNHVTRRGPYLGNSAGVLAVTYNLLNAYRSLPNLATSLRGLGFCAWDKGANVLGAWMPGLLFRRVRRRWCRGLLPVQCIEVQLVPVLQR